MAKEESHERNDQAHSARLHDNHAVSVCEARPCRLSQERLRRRGDTYPDTRREGQFHAEARIGDAQLLFGNGYFSDPSMAAAIYLYVPDLDATYKRAVSLGAKAIREPADMTWGDRVGGVKDTSGNTWWIATNKK
ncbi:MAG: VOC family protein [Candidatus Binatus sp.]